MVGKSREEDKRKKDLCVYHHRNMDKNKQIINFYAKGKILTFKKNLQMVNCFMAAGKSAKIPGKPCRHLNTLTETHTHQRHSANFLEQEWQKSTELLSVSSNLVKDSRWLF